jgi:hypothetical protein
MKPPPFSADAGKLVLELGADATTEALAQALQRLPLDPALHLRLVGLRPPPPFAREQVPAWALALFEAPAPQRAFLDVDAARQVEDVARLEGDALVLGTARVPLSWAAPGGGQVGPPVGLPLSPSTPLSTLVKAIATVRALGRLPVLVVAPSPP